MFGGFPVLSEIEDGVGAVVSAGKQLVEGGAEKVLDLAEAAKDLASDPVGFVEKQLGELVWSTVKDSVGAGLDRVAGGLAKQAGLGPLVDGVSAFADVVGEVVTKLIQLAQCAACVQTPTFWSLTGGVYAARVAGLVKRKADCEAFVQGGAFLQAVGIAAGPALKMLPCAIEAAFAAPLPAGRPQASGATPGNRARNALAGTALESSLAILQATKVGAARSAARAPAVGSVSRSADKLDLAVVRSDGAVVAAAWQPGDKAWRGWWPIGNGRSTPGATVTVVSRSADHLDAFMVGLDGRVCTAAWQPGDKAWRGWWPIGSLRTLPGTRVGAVSRSRDKLDLFAAAVDGLVYTAAWQPGDKAWRGWWPVAKGQTLPGAPITPVCRSADKLDVFMTGLDGRVWSAAWQPGDKQWRGWWPIGDLRTLPGSEVGAVSRSADKLDVFVRSNDGAIATAAWQPGDREWRGWWRLS